MEPFLPELAVIVILASLAMVCAGISRAYDVQADYYGKLAERQAQFIAENGL